MKYLLLGGAHNVGKSESIYRCTLNLLSRGFNVIQGSIPPQQKDFKAILEGHNEKAEIIRILINTATDTPKIIERFKKFRDQFPACDICISSVRDENFWPRKDFYSILELDPKMDFILEIPLAKITRRGKNHSQALGWYRQKIDALIAHNLANEPFNL